MISGPWIQLYLALCSVSTWKVVCNIFLNKEYCWRAKLNFSWERRKMQLSARRATVSSNGPGSGTGPNKGPPGDQQSTDTCKAGLTAPRRAAVPHVVLEAVCSRLAHSVAWRSLWPNVVPGLLRDHQGVPGLEGSTFPSAEIKVIVWVNTKLPDFPNSSPHSAPKMITLKFYFECVNFRLSQIETILHSFWTRLGLHFFFHVSIKI